MKRISLLIIIMIFVFILTGRAEKKYFKSNTQITFDRGYNNCSWFPDGKKIICDKYNYETYTSDIWTMEADGKNRKLLIPGGKQPAVSPDGRSIAYVSSDPKQTGIHLVNLKNNKKIRLTTKSVDKNPSWTPDGRQILYATFANMNFGVNNINRDGSGMKRLSNGGESYPNMSPKDGKIVFERGLALGMMNADGSAIRMFHQKNEQREPSWSPDGKSIIFTIQIYQPICNVCVMSVEDRVFKQYTKGRTGARTPRFSPNGKQMIYIGKDAKAQDNIWIMTLR